MIKEHTDNERGNSVAPLHGPLSLISRMDLLYASSDIRDGTYHGF